jgi:hypothetical protein
MTIELEDGSEGLRQYLEFSVEARHRFFKNQHENRPYVCMEDFVLQEGTMFVEFSPWQPTLGGRNRYRPRMVQQCFDNAYKAALASRGRLRYVEGYAQSAFFPVSHAWNIDADDLIVDTTWCGGGEDLGAFRRPEPGSAYMGVVFDLNYVRKTRTKGNTSMIDRWEEGWPLLQQKFVQQNADMEVPA